MKFKHSPSPLRDIVLVGVISLLPFLIIFASPLLPHTSDGGVHLPRMGAYFKALVDGHFPVRWAGDLNFGYGLPLFNFIYQAPYLITSLFLFLGAGLVTSFKLALALSFVLSGVFMYLFSMEWTGDRRKALWMTLFYQFAPFRLVEILVRGALGGIYAYTFLPLVLLGIMKLVKRPTRFTFTLTAVAGGLLVISHNSLSLLFFAVATAFTFVFVRDAKTRLVGLFALAYGLLLSAFFWIPAIAEHKYTYGDLFMKDLFRTHFPPLPNFFIPNPLNVQSLRTAEISVQLGIFHVIAIILALWGIKANRFDASSRRIMLFSLVLTTVAFFFMQPVSLFLWERIPLLRQFQFPWRLLAVTSFSTSLLSLAYAKFVDFRSNTVFYGILSLLVFTTAFFWYPRQGFDRVNEANFWNYPLNTTYFGETDVIWSAGPAKAYPKARAEVIGGQGEIGNFSKKTQLHTFRIDAQTDAQLVDHTQYFPGWRVYVDGAKTPVEFQDQNWRGEMTFWVPKGTHDVRVVFEESKIRLIADAISGLSIILLIISLGLKRITKP